MTARTGPALTLYASALAAERGERLVFRDLSFVARSGQGLLVTGANGAGKTTLIRMLAGFLPPAAGEIRLEGGDEGASVAEQCHYAGHANGLKGALTVEENLLFWGRYLSGGAPDPARISRALAHFALEPLANLPVRYLSAGQKRRAGLARLLAAERPIWFLDEPTASLDAASAEALTTAANAHLAKGGLVVAATHLPLPLSPVQEIRLGRTPERAA